MKLKNFHIWVENEWECMEMNMRLNYIEDIRIDEIIMISMNDIFIVKYYWKFQIGELWIRQMVIETGETSLVSP